MSKQSLMTVNPIAHNELINSLDDILTLAKIAAASKMFPEVITEQHAAVKILAGRELGVPPMAALRGIHVIKGKAEIGAGLLAAMIKQSGKYDYKVVNSDDSIAELAWYENGALVGRSAFTLADAERAGLIQPASAWKKYPRAMLFARALTEGQRRYAPDVAIGAAYAPGEIDGEVIDVTPEPEPEPMTSEAMQTAYEKKLAERVEAYEREKAAQPPAPEPKEKGLTVEELREQVIELLRAMRAKYKITDAQVYSALAGIAGRPIGKIAELKKAELPLAFEMLENWDADLLSAAQEAV